MKTFVDNANRTWTISVNVGAVKRMRELAKFDLMGGNIGENIGRLSDDPVLLVDVLWAIVFPQAEKLSIPAEEFAEAIAGDAITFAADALLEEIVDFFPGPKRKLLRQILDRTKEAEKKMLERLEKMVNSPEVQEQIDKNVESILNSAMK